MAKRLQPILVALVLGCGSSGGNGTSKGGPDTGSGGATSTPGQPIAGVTDDACGTVRMTHYAASDRAWCGFDRTDPVLPDFVRAGMTVAVAEPYAGSSYQGAPGEACGECWELDTTFATQLVMVHDLCPIDGNPICAGSYFHFDVSDEVAAAIDGGESLGEAALRRVPCPVTGNVHAYISDRNQYGYLKLAFFNHRFPIRKAEYRAVGGDQWQAMTRCLARWCVETDMDTFSEGGPGAVFRLTSAAGELVEGTEVLTYDVAADTTFDTGIQFAPAQPEGSACEFVPPGNVYDDGWGGIEGVRWEPNTWGDTVLSETSDGCADGSQSCLLLRNFAGSGLHATYRHDFPTTTFSTLSLQLRAAAGGGEVQVAPRSEASRCANPTTVQVGSEWTPVQIDVAASCPDTPMLRGLTISLPSAQMDLVVDEIRFE